MPAARGGHAEATPTNRGTPMGCYRAVPGWPYPLVLTKTDQAVHAPEGRASQAVADLMTWLRSAWGDGSPMVIDTVLATPAGGRGPRLQ